MIHLDASQQNELLPECNAPGGSKEFAPEKESRVQQRIYCHNTSNARPQRQPASTQVYVPSWDWDPQGRICHNQTWSMDYQVIHSQRAL